MAGCWCQCTGKGELQENQEKKGLCGCLGFSCQWSCWLAWLLVIPSETLSGVPSAWPGNTFMFLLFQSVCKCLQGTTSGACLATAQAVSPPLKRLLGNTGEQNWRCHQIYSQGKHTAADGLNHINIQSELTEYLVLWGKRFLQCFWGQGRFPRMTRPGVCHGLKLSCHIQLLLCN